MLIETKYNIGDEVWTLNFFNEPQKGEICSVDTFHTKRKTNDFVSYYIHPVGNRKENEIFKTKEELLKSL